MQSVSIVGGQLFIYKVPYLPYVDGFWGLADLTVDSLGRVQANIFVVS